MLNATVPFSTVVKDLGVLDSQLSMTSHTATLSQSCFPPATPQVDQIVTDTGCNTDRNLYTLLLALGWTAVTLYLLVSIVDCYTSCKSTHQNYGDHCFAVQGPRVWDSSFLVWNSLTAEMCAPNSTLNTQDAFITRTWLRYVRVFAVADPSVCNVGASYSGGWTFRQYFFTPVYAVYVDMDRSCYTLNKQYLLSDR